MSVNPTDPPEKKDLSGYAFALAIGGQMLGALIACGVPGWWFDKKFGTAPWLTLVGVLAGISLGFYQLVRLAGQRQNGGAKRR